MDTGNVFNLVESSSFHTRDSILNEISISGIQHTKANFITKDLLSIQFSPLTLDTSKVISLEGIVYFIIGALSQMNFESRILLFLRK